MAGRVAPPDPLDDFEKMLEADLQGDELDPADEYSGPGVRCDVCGCTDEVERAALDDATGYRRSSRDTYLQRLSARRLVQQVGRGAVRASEELF